jgi:hypothetical protein
MTRFRTLGAVFLLLSALAVTGGCSVAGTTLDTSPDGHLHQIDAAYRQGQRARATLSRNGIPPTDKSCADTFVSTGASHSDYDASNRPFQAQRKVAYINGCMGRPNTHASTLPSPSASSSPSASRHR